MDGLGRLLKFIWRSSRRIAVFVVGAVVSVAGVVMLVTPGPGILVIVAGLAILATEFAWAEYLLDKAKHQAARAARKARQKAQRRRNRKRGGLVDAVIEAERDLIETVVDAEREIVDTPEPPASDASAAPAARADGPRRMEDAPADQRLRQTGT